MGEGGGTEREKEEMKRLSDMSRSEAPSRSASEETQPPASDKEHGGASCLKTSGCFQSSCKHPQSCHQCVKQELAAITECS